MQKPIRDETETKSQTVSRNVKSKGYPTDPPSNWERNNILSTHGCLYSKRNKFQSGVILLSGLFQSSLREQLTTSINITITIWSAS
eukprot:3883228-Amphidinium_carterae.1